MQAVLIYNKHFAGLDLSNVLGIDQIERAGLGRDAICTLNPSQNKRTKATRIANSYQSLWRQKEKRKRTLGIFQYQTYRFECIFRPCSSNAVKDRFCVGRRRKYSSGLFEFGSLFRGKRQISVMANGYLAMLTSD